MYLVPNIELLSVLDTQLLQAPVVSLTLKNNFGSLFLKINESSKKFQSLSASRMKNALI